MALDRRADGPAAGGLVASARAQPRRASRDHPDNGLALARPVARPTIDETLDALTVLYSRVMRRKTTLL